MTFEHGEWVELQSSATTCILLMYEAIRMTKLLDTYPMIPSYIAAQEMDHPPMPTGTQPHKYWDNVNG